MDQRKSRTFPGHFDLNSTVPGQSQKNAFFQDFSRTFQDSHNFPGFQGFPGRLGTLHYNFAVRIATPLKNGTCVKKVIRRGHSMPVPLTSSSTCCNNYGIKGESWHHFRNCEKSNDGNPRKRWLSIQLTGWCSAAVSWVDSFNYGKGDKTERFLHWSIFWYRVSKTWLSV